MKEHGVIVDKTEEQIAAEFEIAHRLGKRDQSQQGDRPRQIIAKLYSRPFRNALLRAAKGKGDDGKTDIFEDLCKEDNKLKQNAVPHMKKAYEDGKKARFRHGKFFIDGHIPQF